jgi:pimeloyl-ACP methyl ester carboxylesterase
VWAETYGFHVLAPALPGFAGSPPAPLEDYRPSTLARIVVEALKSRGIGRFSLVGYSWGGSIGCRIEPEHLDALVLLDVGYQSYDKTPTLERRLVEFADADFAHPVIVANAFHGVDLEPPVHALPMLAAAGVEVLLLAATEPDVERRAADLGHFRSALPNAKVVEISGGEHNLLQTRPDETIPAVGDWLRLVTMARA